MTTCQQLRSLDQLVDIKDKPALLRQLQSNQTRISTLLNDNSENILHIIASEKNLKNSQSISGNTDMTLYQIVEFCIHNGGKYLPFKAEKQNGQTPLHYAFKSGNIEVALWIIQIIKKEYGIEAFSELLNSMDNDGMRPIDLLAFKIDDHHKQFIKTYHNEEKNYKLSKQFDAYSWGHSDDYQLGYTQLNNERKYPKKIQFPVENASQQIQDPPNEAVNIQPPSIKDIKVANTFTLALSEDGRLYSWGLGLNGHLGLGDENSRISPELVDIDLKEEEKRVKNLKKKHKNSDEVEELLTMHSFVKSASKVIGSTGGIGSQSSFLEQESLITYHNNRDLMNSFFLNEDRSKNKKSGKHGMLGKGIISSQSFQQEGNTKIELNAKLILLTVDRPCVAKIACSNKHSLICTNTGAVYSWGENDYQQLGYQSRKQSNHMNKDILYETTPKKVHQLNKQFIIDVACGDHHSCVINNLKEVYVWGSNKEGQLGQDMENCLVNGKAQKIVLHEYMNSSTKEKFLYVKAKANYTVLVCESKNIYISDKVSNQFLPVFGRSGNNSLNKKLETNVFLGNDYILALDYNKSIFCYKINSPSQSKQHQDKKIANEIFQNSNFIEIYPTDRDIWAVNSLRQLLVCRDFKKSNTIEFTPVNDTFNVMKAAVGNKHQVVIKIVKQLDDLMVRDITQRPEYSQEGFFEDPLDIPMPSSCMMDGVSMNGGAFTISSFTQEQLHEQEQPVEEELQYIPSLADLCIDQLAKNITLENALDLYEIADHLIIDELKINCLKFISLNIVSFLESSYFEKLISLPIYIIRDLENFIKLDDIEKYVYFDMKTIEDAEYNHNVQCQNQQKSSQSLSQEYCGGIYMEIMELFNEYVETERLSDVLKTEICSKTHKFRAILRKSHKKLRKGSSNVYRKQSDDIYGEGDDIEAVVNYLEMINDFIKQNINEEMNEFLKITPEKSPDHHEDAEIDSHRDQTIAATTTTTSSTTAVILKKKKSKNNRKQQEQKQQNQTKNNQSKKTEETENIEQFFLKAKDEKQVEKKKFEMQSLENDFMIVEQSEKKNNKVVFKSKQKMVTTQTPKQEEKVLLCDLIGIDSKLLGHNPSQKQKKDSFPEKEFWNYLEGEQENENSNTRLRIMSFEEIQKEELSKKNKKRVVNKTGEQQSTATSQSTKAKPKPLSVAKKEEDSKNDWGMITEKDEIDFDEVLLQEKKKIEEEKVQLRRDEEISRRLIEEELRQREEELLQQVLQASLLEFKRQEAEQQHEIGMGNYVQPGENNGGQRRRGPRGGANKRSTQQQQTTTQKWVPKQK